MSVGMFKFTPWVGRSGFGVSAVAGNGLYRVFKILFLTGVTDMQTQRTFLGVLVLLAVLGGAARAQGLGVITGTVTDSSGAAVPGARVTAAETGTTFKRSIPADETGHYTIPSLRPTEYTLSVEAANFQKFVQSGITLLADQTATVNVRLQLGSVSENVTVSANASLVDVATATLTDVVGQTRIEELPLNGRAVAQLIGLVPGATSAVPTEVTSQTALPGSVAPSINGSGTNQTGYMLDGAAFLDQYLNRNIPFPFPDALQEFSVQTNNYSARYGGNAGGVVNVVTKSGTNELHGNLFAFNRNQDYNARNSFSQVRDVANRNEFGGTVGGPVYIPKYYNGRDRTFFFFGYQGTRLRRSGLGTAYVPTPEELDGDFSALLSANNPNNIFGRSVTINDPATGKPFPGNIIPTNRFDPASVKLATYLPQATGTGFAYYPTSTNQNVDAVIVRIDHQLGSKDRLAARFYSDHVVLAPQYNPKDILSYGLGYDIPARNFMIQETHTFRPNLLNQASFVYSGVPVAKTAASNSPNPASFGVKGIWQPDVPFIQSIGVTGYFTVSGGAVGPFNRSSLSWQDDVTWVHGSHNLTFGGIVQRSRLDLGDLFNAPGAFTFTADVVNNALAAFMIGQLRTFVQGAGEFKNNRDIFPAFYATDSYHAMRRLTLNFGVRYEPYFPWNEIEGRVEQFNVSKYQAGVQSQVFTNAPPGLLFPGDPGVPRKGTTGSLTNFAPRAGFAYSLTNDAKTSLRGGIGMFYDTQTVGDINNRFADLTPFSPQINMTPAAGPFSNPVLGVPSYPFPASYPPPKNSVFPAPVLAVTYDPSTNYRVPVTYSWNLTIERQLADDWLLQSAYVGSHSSHGMETIQLNPAQYIPGSTLGTDARRIFAGYGSITMDSQSGNANYHALQLVLKKRLARGVNLSAAYTFSKSTDDKPNGVSSGNSIGGDAASVLPWYDPDGRQLDRGPSGFDHTHRFVVSYVWLLPALSHANRWVKGAFGAWELSGISTLQSGDPLTITAGVDRSMTGLGYDRAVYNGQAPYSSSGCGAQTPCLGWLNANAFALPATGTFGNVGKGALRGPGSIGFDAGISKNFRAAERLKLQFRGEFFNVLNHANPSNPATSASAPGFGLVKAVGDPRVGQVALKLAF